MSKSKLTYKPHIERSRKSVTGDVDLKIRKPDDPLDGELAEDINQYTKLLDSALATDAQYTAIRDELAKRSKDLSIKINTEDHPTLREAISLLAKGAQDDTIDFDLFDKSLRILDNAFVVQNGYDPSQMLYTKNSGDGHKVPRVTMPESMSCDDIADFDLQAHQSPSEQQSLESIVEKRRKQTQVSFLAILFKMLLAFTFRLLAKLLKRTRLHKVPLAGSVVKSIIRKLNRAADKLMNWLRTGQSADGVDDSLSDIVTNMDSIAAEDGSPCIMAATGVVKHALNWAAHTSGQDDTPIDPKLLMMRSLLDKYQSNHEQIKFSIETTMPDDVKNDPNIQARLDSLHENTRSRRNYANRYFNRSIRP